MLLHHAQYGVQKTAGYTMLFAVLVSSILLSIGIFILNVSKKEVILSAIARESAIAFYAADGGVECAHYWNAQGDLFGLNTNGTKKIDSVIPEGQISCGGSGITVTFPNFPATLPTVNFTVESKFKIDTLTHCAEVTIKKGYKNIIVTTITPPSSVTTYIPDEAAGTIINSLGYNTCVITDPRRVERGLRETLQ